MSAANRRLKLKLFSENPLCHWCGEPTILTESNRKRGLPHNAATVDHLISRINPGRFVKKKKGQVRRVLSCYKCNQERSRREIFCLSRSEVLKRSQGFSLSPRGNPTFKETLPTLKDVLKVLQERA